VTSDPARISVTAKISAYYRKFSDIAFAAEVAMLIGADEAFAEIVREHALEPDSGPGQMAAPTWCSSPSHSCADWSASSHRLGAIWFATRACSARPPRRTASSAR